MIHIIQIFTSTIKNGKKITNKPRISPRCTRSPVSRGSTAAGSARLGHAPLRTACLGGWQAKPRVGAAGGRATRRGPGMRWRGPGRYAPPTPTCPAHSTPACLEPRAWARPRGGAAHRPPPVPGRVGGRKLKEGGRRKLLSGDGWEEMLRERERNEEDKVEREESQHRS